MAVNRSQYLSGAAAKRAMKALASIEVQAKRLAGAKTEKSRCTAAEALLNKTEAVQTELQSILDLSKGE